MTGLHFAVDKAVKSASVSELHLARCTSANRRKILIIYAIFRFVAVVMS